MTNFKTAKYILSLIAMVWTLAVSADTPAAELQQVADRIGRASGITADFTLTSGGHSVNGSLKSQGKKFALLTPTSSTWYDGSSMTVYTSASREATIWTPSGSELAESNPLLYLGMAKNYNVASATGGKGEKVLVLTPRRRGGNVKSIRLTINASTMLPKAMEITAGGRRTTITIRKLNLGSKIDAGAFTFPKSRYPGVKITDLR